MTFKRRDWHLIFEHTLREENLCADWSANFSFFLDDSGMRIFSSPLSKLSLLVFDDVTGISIPRLVPV